MYLEATHKVYVDLRYDISPSWSCCREVCNDMWYVLRRNVACCPTTVACTYSICRIMFEDACCMLFAHLRVFLVLSPDQSHHHHLTTNRVVLLGLNVFGNDDSKSSCSWLSSDPLPSKELFTKGVNIQNSTSTTPGTTKCQVYALQGEGGA